MTGKLVRAGGETAEHERHSAARSQLFLPRGSTVWSVHNIFCGRVGKRFRMEDLPLPTDVVLHIARMIAIIHLQRVVRGFLVRDRLIRICEGRIHVDSDDD